MNCSRDENNRPTIIGALNTDGKTIIRIQVNQTNNALKVDDNTTGSDYGPVNALRDENDVPCLMAVSSSDGKTPISLYVNSSGKLLIKST